MQETTTTMATTWALMAPLWRNLKWRHTMSNSVSRAPTILWRCKKKRWSKYQLSLVSGSDVLLGHRVNIGVIIIQINPFVILILQVYPVRIQPRYYATFDGTRKSSLNATWKYLKRCCGMLVYWPTPTTVILWWCLPKIYNSTSLSCVISAVMTTLIWRQYALHVDTDSARLAMYTTSDKRFVMKARVDVSNVLKTNAQWSWMRRQLND